MGILRLLDQRFKISPKIRSIALAPDLDLVPLEVEMGLVYH